MFGRVKGKTCHSTKHCQPILYSGIFELGSVNEKERWCKEDLGSQVVMLSSERAHTVDAAWNYGRPVLANLPKQVDYSRYLVDVTRVMLKALGRHIDPDVIAAVFRKSHVCYSTLIVSLLYLLRYLQARPIQGRHDTPDGLTLLVVCLLTASKFVQDQNASNVAWASLTTATVETFNHAELDFLSAIGYRVCVGEQVFVSWVEYLFKPENLRGYYR